MARHHDVIVIGAGSGNAVIDDSFSELDVAIIEDGPFGFGGTCLNAGCIPSKMLVRVATAAEDIRAAGRLGVDADLHGVRWPDVQKRIFGRLDAEVADGEAGRRNSGFVTVYSGRAHFTGPRRLCVELADGPTDLEADQIVIAAGSRPLVPAPIAAAGLHYETSDTVMRLAQPPNRLAILGGGYIAAELAHVFAAAGSEVTVIEKAARLLDTQDDSIADAFTHLAADRFTLRLGREVTSAHSLGEGGLRLILDDESAVDADTLLVAASRIPNGDRLELDRAGIATHDDGRIVVDEYQRTTAEGVFALGDVCTPVPLKHVANREAKVVAHNLRSPDDLWRTEHAAIPSAVFADPEIASVGATERDCRARGLQYTVGVARYAQVAYGWAAEDTTGFCKIIAERGTGRLLGAHILGSEASLLIQPLVIALTLGIDAHRLATAPYWPHPALTEVVENALLGLDLASPGAAR